MKIKDIALSAAYVGQRVVKAIAVGAQEVWSAVKYILFADPVVEQICATNWGDGAGITEEDAAKVTDIGTTFKENTKITSFDELQYFTSLTEIYGSSNNGAFQGCSSLKSVRLPDGITQLGRQAFDGCSLTSVNLPNTITRIGERVFYGCQAPLVIDLPYCTSIGWGAFNGCSRLTRIERLGENVKFGAANGQSQGVFANCISLSYVRFPLTIKELGSQLFNGCTNLEDFNLEEIAGNITYFGLSVLLGTKLQYEELAFHNLEKVESSLLDGVAVKRITSLGRISKLFRISSTETEFVRLPSTLTELGSYYTFNASTTLTNLIVEAEVPFTINSSYFINKNAPILKGGGYIYVPDASVDTYKTTSGWLDYASIIRPLSQYVES